MTGWRRVPLKDLGEEVRGSITPQDGTRYAHYSVPAFDSARPDLEDGAEIKSAKRELRAGDVLICRINPRINRVWVVGEHQEPIVGSTEWITLRLADSAPVDPQFLIWYLRSPRFRSQITASVSGVTGSHTRAKPKQVLSYEVPLPPLQVQQEIVEAIERAMTLLQAVTREIASTTTKSGLLRHALAHAAVTGRLIGLSPGQRGVWPTPPDWDWRPVADVAEVRGGIQKKPDRRPVKNRYPFLRVANVQRNQLDLENIHEVELFDGELDRYRLEPGDLLVVEGNGSIDHIGRSAIWDGSIGNCVHQNHLIRVRPGPSISPHWLNLVWNSPVCTEQIQSVAQTTSGLFTLSTKKVASVQIPVPPRDVQDQIVGAVEARRGVADHLEGSILPAVEARTNTLRRSILKAAFEGRLTGNRSRSDGVLDEAIA